MRYYQEMAELFLREKKNDEAVECLQKSLSILKKAYGTESFTVIECYLSLVQLLEGIGRKEQADELFRECLDNFDSKAQSKSSDDNSFNSDIDLSLRIKQQQQKVFRGVTLSVKEKDANVIQKVALYLRERQEYLRACDLLEKVL